MTKAEAVAQFNAELDHPNSAQLALAIVQGRIHWLEWVTDGEYSIRDMLIVQKACRDFYAAIAPIVAKYIDGDPAAR